jgi:hypothetical protein
MCAHEVRTCGVRETEGASRFTLGGNEGMEHGSHESQRGRGIGIGFGDGQHELEDPCDRCANV